jgi:hypothetical protein
MAATKPGAQFTLEVYRDGVADSDDVDLRAIDPIVVSLMLSLFLRAPLRRVSPTGDSFGTQSAAGTTTHVDSRQRARSMNRKG